MRISIRLLCADLLVPSGVQELDVTDSATVAQALTSYLKLHPVEDPLNKLYESMFLVGSRPAKLDTVLQDHDELMVLRILHGG